MQTAHFQDVADTPGQCGQMRHPLGSATLAHAPAPQAPSPRQPWTLPVEGLAVFHGAGDTARLSHYFLPRLLLAGKRVLFLDGANSADPRLLERLARERGVAFETFSRRMQIARAFTCFQLTELIARVPKFLEDFPADALILTALPDLYFDEDVRDGNARAAFEQALRDLRRWTTPGAWARPLAIAIFSSATSFTPPAARRRFFTLTCAAAKEAWEFRPDADGRMKLTRVGAPLPAAS